MFVSCLHETFFSCSIYDTFSKYYLLSHMHMHILITQQGVHSQRSGALSPVPVSVPRFGVRVPFTTAGGRPRSPRCQAGRPSKPARMGQAQLRYGGRELLKIMVSMGSLFIVLNFRFLTRLTEGGGVYGLRCVSTCNEFDFTINIYCVTLSGYY